MIGHRLSPNRVAFAAVAAAYLAATTGEWLLPPLFPLLARDLGIGAGSAGVAFGILGVSIAVGGLCGGFVLGRLGPRIGVAAGLALVAAGAFASSLAGGLPSLLLGQVVLGLGSGTFFASGVRSAGVLGGQAKRGLAVGIFGVAFSGGVALAGLLASLGDVWGWRTSFVVTACIALATAVAVLPVRLPRPAPSTAARGRFSIRRAVAPVGVGGVAAASQYGTVAFLPLFAVEAWGLSPGAAALVITVSRILSIPAKLVSGNAADRAGSLRIARRLGIALAAFGAWWSIAPERGSAVAAAVVFGAVVASLGPVGNVLALDAFEGRAQLLGAFRSVQVGLGAATSALLGLGAHLFGLRVAIAVAAVAIPASLVLLGRGSGPDETSVPARGA